MIIRLTKKLATKLKVQELAEIASSVNPLEEWFAHLFNAGRIQYILITNPYSVYSNVIPAKGVLSVEELALRHFTYIDEVLKSDGIVFSYQDFIKPNNLVIRSGKTNSRGVLGSMNDLIYQSKFYITERNLSPLEVSRKLNALPAGYLKYELPYNAMAKLVRDSA